MDTRSTATGDRKIDPAAPQAGMLRKGVECAGFRVAGRAVGGERTETVRGSFPPLRVIIAVQKENPRECPKFVLR